MTCFVRAAPINAGIGMGVEPAFNDRANDIAEGVLGNSVFEWQGANDSFFRLVDGERPIRLRVVCTRLEIFLQFQKVFRQAGGVGKYFGAVSFVFACLSVCFQQIFIAVNLIVNVIDAFVPHKATRLPLLHGLLAAAVLFDVCRVLPRTGRIL